MKLKNYIEKLQNILETEGNLSIYYLEVTEDDDYHGYTDECLREGIQEPELLYVDINNTYDYDKNSYLVHKPIKVLVL